MAELRTAHAILIAVPLAGLIIGVSLYVALRPAAGAGASVAPAGARAGSPAGAGPALPAPPPGAAGALPSGARKPPVFPAQIVSAAPPRTEHERAARDQVAAGLEAQRATLRARCWDAIPSREGAPPSSRWVWNVTFGPSGAEVARGLVEQPGTSRAEVTACVSRALSPLSISPPPPRPLRVEVPFELP